MHPVHDPRFLARLGPVLRVATEEMVKEEMPHEIAHLLIRLRELETAAREQPRREPNQG